MADTITLVAVGDVCLSGYVREHIREHGPQWPFQPCLEPLHADVAFANLECVLFRPRHPEPTSRQNMAVTWPEAVGLPQAGFNVLNLANNHILDLDGQIGLETMDFCDVHSIWHVGFGPDQQLARRAAILDVAGLKVGVLGYVEDVPGLKRRTSPGPAYIHEPNIVADIAAATQAGADVIVLSLHADVEFVDWPGPQRVALSRRLIDAGANIILAHHPHVTQGIETYHGGLIAHSLGNFIFPVHGNEYMEHGSEWTDKSFVLRIQINRKGYVSHEVVPVRISPQGRPEPMKRNWAAEFMARHDRISNDLADPAALQRAWLDTARRYLRININWLMNSMQKEGMDKTATEFMQRLLYDENIPWLQQTCQDLKEQMPPRPWEQSGSEALGEP